MIILANETVSKSWFCVFNNPEEHGLTGEPQEIVDAVVAKWVGDSTTRTAAAIYCISEKGLKHLHMVLEDTKAMRFSVPKKIFNGMHIEPTKGDKASAEAYINKTGKFAEHGEKIIAKAQHGEIKAAQGKRNDLEEIAMRLEAGQTPKEILMKNFEFMRYQGMIKQFYYMKRDAETPDEREIKVVYHLGAAGSGKTYTRHLLAQEHGSDNVFMVSTFGNDAMSNYNAEPYIFIDEYRGNWQYGFFLNVISSSKYQIHSRYANVSTLWKEVHIASVLPPETVYAKMVGHSEQCEDTYAQMKRRIHFIVYHFVEDGKYKQCTIPMSEYRDYDTLRHQIENGSLNFYDERVEDVFSQMEEQPPPVEQLAMDGVQSD